MRRVDKIELEKLVPEEHASLLKNLQKQAKRKDNQKKKPSIFDKENKKSNMD